MKFNAPLEWYNVQCSICCGILELKKRKEERVELFLYLVILAPLCVAGQKIYVPLGQYSFLYAVAFQNFRRKGKRSECCYILLYLRHCVWLGQDIYDFKCTPGVVPCTVFYMLWHFKNLRRVIKMSEYFCDESCFWCGSIILQPSVGSCVIKWCSGLMKLVLN